VRTSLADPITSELRGKLDAALLVEEVMTEDAIVDEIRRFRDEYAARFNYDLSAMIRDLKQQAKERGLKTVSRTPIRVTPVPPVDDLPPINNDMTASH
jgi:hypothetical protein